MFEQEDLGRGFKSVGKAFISEIEGWRESLAEEIYRRNRWLSKRELDCTVQWTIRTIDRLVFLRICEDGDIEDYGRLEELLDRSDIYEEICQI